MIELELSFCLLKDLRHLFPGLHREFPLLEKLDIGCNNLVDDELDYGMSECVFENLRCLKMSGVRNSFHFARHFHQMRFFPNLRELVLRSCSLSSCQGFRACFLQLETLDLADNLIESWGDVVELCEERHDLKNLILDQNHLFKNVEREGRPSKRSTIMLETLQLSGNPVVSLEAVARICEDLRDNFPNLANLTLKNTPFVVNYGEKNSRALVIKLLPQLVSLNHSPVDNVERVEASRTNMSKLLGVDSSSVESSILPQTILCKLTCKEHGEVCWKHLRKQMRVANVERLCGAIFPCLRNQDISIVFQSETLVSPLSKLCDITSEEMVEINCFAK
eukprot:TRINITY_DN5168_c0_g1_i1.p1 TRINITY_DN5168_c0_g1~~TRINITY_DN5168_c0_g1_i1.p1  ORF type:complete len:335 (-),score=58.90 TRINITY_DN5168_c0_g1_i1:957-1961(-)